MTRDDIENAAKHTIDEYNLNPEYGSYFEHGFIDGAEWRINSVWHDANEMPDLGEAIIVELFGKVWDYRTYDVSDSIHPKAKWAYMNDLIPSKED